MGRPGVILRLLSRLGAQRSVLYQSSTNADKRCDPVARGVWLCMAAMLALGGAACGERDRNAQPAGVAEAFVERMSRVHGDAAAARRAFELLATDAQANLGERAARASGLMGRKVGPEEMLAPSSFTLAFRPRQYTAKISQDAAVVVVTGDSARTQRAELRLVRESGAWRVAVELPPLPTIRQREEPEP
jgi:hypothetical protein